MLQLLRLVLDHDWPLSSLLTPVLNTGEGFHGNTLFLEHGLSCEIKVFLHFFLIAEYKSFKALLRPIPSPLSRVAPFWFQFLSQHQHHLQFRVIY